MKFEITGKQALYYLLLTQFVITALIFMLMMPAFNVGVSTILRQNEAYEWGMQFYLSDIRIGLFFWVLNALIGTVIYFGTYSEEREEPPRKPEPPQQSL